MTRARKKKRKNVGGPRRIGVRVRFRQRRPDYETHMSPMLNFFIDEFSFRIFGHHPKVMVVDLAFYVLQDCRRGRAIFENPISIRRETTRHILRRMSKLTVKKCGGRGPRRTSRCLERLAERRACAPTNRRSSRLPTTVFLEKSNLVTRPASCLRVPSSKG
jgi:hypothetical protein